ncbi:class I SAM-dependent DNA methyltransferase [Spirosoma daeguense]
MNAVEIEEAVSLLAEQPFAPAEFPYSFLEAFGNKSTTIKRLQTGNNNKSDITGGVLQHNNIHIAVCGKGTVTNTLTKLRQSPATARAKAKFILATDGVDFQAEDINSGETIVCNYSDFHDHFGFFLPLAGISTVKQIRESAFDIKATGRLNKLYIELLRHNPDWAKPQRRHDMNHFLARLIFCFFAEDTDIFLSDCLFTSTVQKMSGGDASDVHEIISEIFRAMDTKPEERAEKRIKNWANKFPYVNGELFSGSTETPRFTKIARSYLLHVGNLDWKRINPDIFGSMIQSVADEDERSELGMHYTSVPNILKVLNPLFLDDIRAQLEEAEDNSRKLLNLRKRLSRIRVFDPACGSGNFLVIAYKQLREIEYEINKRRGEVDRPTDIPLTNFRGIELRDFSAEIARLALIIAEFQCDVLYRGQKQAVAEFLPLNAENWITCGNALRIEWLSVCPSTSKGVKYFGNDLFSTPVDQAEIDFENEGGETYICGNPPYQGSVNQTKEQKEDMARIFSGYLSTYKDLDYVTNWLVRAAEYSNSTKAASAFVTTNSICQGEQVAMLWPILFSKGQKISFAHTSFLWRNNAAHNAGVTCIVIGLRADLSGNAMLYDEEVSRSVTSIGPYLTPNSNTIVKKSSVQISGLPRMDYGNKPTDGGYLIMTPQEKAQFISKYPSSQLFIKSYIGSAEFINGKERFCFWIENADLSKARAIDEIRVRLESVRRLRVESRGTQANANAKTPHRFVFAPHQKGRAIIVPRVSSERRPYLPTGLLDDTTVISDSAAVIYKSDTWLIALLASRLHLVWIATVCGKLKTDFRYSNTLGWNTFPVPTLTAKNKEDLNTCAEEILIARERHFPATIADLYDPEKMPEDLRRAHDRNDEVLERIYIGRRFKNDTERLEKLFDLYTKMTTKGKTV